jgi:hypothetical protein
MMRSRQNSEGLLQWIDDGSHLGPVSTAGEADSGVAYLFDDLRKCPALETDPSIPFGTKRSIHTAFELGLACIRIWEVFH